MLNELTEYRQYTAGPSVEEAFRLNGRDPEREPVNLDGIVDEFIKKFEKSENVKAFYKRNKTSNEEKKKVKEEIPRALREAKYAVPVTPSINKKGEEKLEEILSTRGKDELEHISDLSPKKEAFRLSFKNLANDLSGLDRVMTVIARKFLFEDSFYKEKNLSRMDKAEAVKEALRAWCGFSDKGSESGKTNGADKVNEANKACEAFSLEGRDELERIRNWFPGYVLCLLWSKLDKSEREKLPENFQEKVKARPDLAEAEEIFKELITKAGEQKKENAAQVDNMLNRLKKLTGALRQMKRREKSFSEPLFTEEVQRDTADNDAKAITYESIIANAFHEGPLKNRALVVPVPAEPSEGFSFYKHSEAKNKCVPVKTNSADEDLILKLIAVYLMRRQSAPAGGDREFEAVNKADVANWYKRDSLLETKDLELFYADEAGKRRIFRTALVGGNIFKIAIDPDALKGFDVLDAEEAKKEQPEKKILWDYGSGRTFSEYPDD